MTAQHTHSFASDFSIANLKTIMYITYLDKSERWFTHAKVQL